jgi:hypothetical protein
VSKSSKKRADGCVSTFACAQHTDSTLACGANNDSLPTAPDKLDRGDACLLLPCNNSKMWGMLSGVERTVQR